MTFEGKIEKNSGVWLISIPLLDIMTQGRTKKEAFEMLGDLILSFLDYPENLSIEFDNVKGSDFLVRPSNPKEIMPFVLQRLRQASGLSLADIREKLNLKSRNAYARYEKADCDPTYTKLNQLLSATGYEMKLVSK